MVWYAQHWVATATFLPLSVVGALWPWRGLRQMADARKAGPNA